VDNARQVGKIGNFGFIGGLGPNGLVLFALKGYGVKISFDSAARLKEIWLRSWPEFKYYFKWVQSMVGRHKYGGNIQQLFSNRYRGKTTFTAACNSFFQGLAADAAKEAGWYICKAMYCDKTSPLYGFRLVNFIHDEFIGEGPEDRAPEAAEEMSKIMIQVAQKWMPNLKIRAEPCLMDCWSKKAKTIRDENGKLKTWKYMVETSTA
jgi:DNA polymerase I-like protein with 3'-5' exonuclease and polymerase domains